VLSIKRLSATKRTKRRNAADDDNDARNDCVVVMLMLAYSHSAKQNAIKHQVVL